MHIFIFQSVRCTGSCPCLDECPPFNSPVCGSNGQTFRNSCWARKAGMVGQNWASCLVPNEHFHKNNHRFRPWHVTGSALVPTVMSAAALIIIQDAGLALWIVQIVLPR